MKSILKLVVVAGVVATISGCAVNRTTATIDPSGDLAKVKSVHVVKLPKDERGVNVLIADKFRTRGITATTGPEKASGVDAIVTYADRWMWDITMYMLELTVTMRDPGTDYPIATGNSYHTSLTRKSPQEMVDEVVDNIYNRGGQK